MGLFEPSRKGDRFGVRDARGRLVLDADAAARLNAIRAELRRLDRFAASPPLAYSSDAAGRRWQLDRPVSVYAKLTGTSGSAYTWSEATRDASGVSSLLSGGRTGTAYEANLATGLTGTYATLDWTPASGDWRFQAIRAGAGGGGSPPCSTGSITVIAGQDCGAASVVGATVTVKLGTTTVGSGSTTSAGYTVTGLVPGIYSVTVVYGGATKTATAEVGPDCSPVTVTTSSFGQSYIDVAVQGCNGWVAGASFSVFQSGVLLGSGTSLGSLVSPPYVRINFTAPSNGTTFTVTTSLSPYFLSGSSTFAAGSCAVTAALGSPNQAAGYACCGSSFFRSLPYGPTLNCTVGSVSLTLSGNGSGAFRGNTTQSVTGMAGNSCLGSPTTISACFVIGWSCGTLTIQYHGCPSGANTGLPLDTACGVTLNTTITSTESSHTTDPLASTGTLTIAGTSPLHIFNGTWTVTE